MIIVNLPYKKEIILKYAIFDMNGTLTVDGKLADSTKNKLFELSKQVEVFVLTADTFGKAQEQFKNLPVKLFIIDKKDGTNAKNEFIKKLGYNCCVAIGNGNNDKLMLENAVLSIGVIMREGISVRALLNSDIIVTHIDDAIDLLLNPKRIIATIRE